MIGIVNTLLVKPSHVPLNWILRLNLHVKLSKILILVLEGDGNSITRRGFECKLQQPLNNKINLREGLLMRTLKVLVSSPPGINKS